MTDVPLTQVDVVIASGGLAGLVTAAVLFTGSERSTWPDFMAGAVESGHAAAAKLRSLL